MFNKYISQTKTLLNPDREKTWQEQLEEGVDSACPSMSYTQRLGGCMFCVVCGFLLSFGSFFRFTDLLLGRPTAFVVGFTLGNIISMIGTCFLSGPFNQMKSMFAKTRAIATTIYLLSIIGCLAIAFAMNDFRAQGLLLIIMCIVQWLALIWYILSYIPFARTWAATCCKTACSDS